MSSRASYRAHGEQPKSSRSVSRKHYLWAMPYKGAYTVADWFVDRIECIVYAWSTVYVKEGARALPENPSLKWF